MTVTRTSDDEVRATVIALEEQRCRAITEGDWTGLAELLTDDFTYGFLSARIEDRPTYLQHLPSRPHGVLRQEMSVRVYGDAAVMTGEFSTFDLTSKETLNAGTSLQIWIRQPDERWLLAALSTTRFGERSTHWGTPK